MDHPAPTDHPVHDLVRRRWSPRVFSGQEVTAFELSSLFEAARWAASSFNEQPWSFIVATRDEPEDYERILTCLGETNQAWAWHAPVLMLSVAKLAFDRNGIPNRHAFHDVGQASATMSLQATAMGLFAHQMAGFDLDKARRTFAIPESHEPVAAIALGHPADPATLGGNVFEHMRKKRERKRLRAFVYAGVWGKPAAIVG